MPKMQTIGQKTVNVGKLVCNTIYTSSFSQNHIPVPFEDYLSSLSLCHPLSYPEQFGECVHDTFWKILSIQRI